MSDSIQNITSIDKSDMSKWTSIPADVPADKYMYYQNGYYHYPSVCCPWRNHTGIVLSTNPNLPTGCSPPPPQKRIENGEIVTPPVGSIGLLISAPKGTPVSITIDLAKQRANGSYEQPKPGERVVEFIYTDEDPDLKRIARELEGKFFVVRNRTWLSELNFQQASEIQGYDRRQSIELVKGTMSRIAPGVFWLQAMSDHPEWFVVTTT